MATVPLYQRSAKAPRTIPFARIPNAAGAADVDYQRLGALAADANMQPELPRDYFRGDAIAGQARAEAVQGLGQVLSVIAQENAKIQDDKDIMEAQSAMKMAAVEYKASLETNTDPRTWLAGWQKQSEGLKKTLLTKKGMSGRARHVVGLSLEKFNGDMAANLLLSSVRENKRQVNMMYDVEEKRAIKDGNLPVARGFIEDRKKKGYITEPEAEDKLLELSGIEKEQKLQSLAGTTAKEALMAADVAANPESMKEYGLTDYEKYKWSQQYRSMALSREALELDLVEDFFASGKYRSVEDLQASEENLRPSTMKALEVKIRNNMAVDPVEYEKQYAKITAYNAAMDEPGLQKAELVNEIKAKFPTAHSDELLSQLNEREEATKQGLSATDAEVTSVLQEVTADMEAGDYGVYKVPYDRVAWDPKRGENGSWVRKRFEWEKGDDLFVPIEVDQDTNWKLRNEDFKESDTIEDLKAKKVAAGRAAGVRSELASKVKRQEFKTAPEVREYYRKTIEGKTLNKARKVVNPDAPPVGMEGDLPSMQQGGTINPVLIPNDRWDRVYQQTR